MHDSGIQQKVGQTTVHLIHSIILLFGPVRIFRMTQDELMYPHDLVKD